ncbi:uncharacterized protein LOC107303877 [Oryza brachyantha]|uniref:uncharacterized protein LOC107303877 n=1 Tax=Oryza brachyantha TaxID=4533 RepID=UPI00077676B5|nr:uncharacterized protein LOC107303877 [Oryza brachyantha]
MVATLRPEGAPPPVYDDRRDEFTLDIHHGGFFVGSGNVKSYVDERVCWFDSIEADTWSPLWFPDFAEQLGYQNNMSLKIYWLLPGKTLVDGLRLILSDADTNVMAKCAEDVKNLVVYFDHEDLYNDVNWDDVVANSELPKGHQPIQSAVCRKQSYTKVAYFLHKFEER